jgi:hypothetical protein
MFDTEKCWQLLMQICSDFSQSEIYHKHRILLLSTQSKQWYHLIEFLDDDLVLFKDLLSLNKEGFLLYVTHQDTPDLNWSLVNFYVTQLEALPASTLLLKSAHQAHIKH